MDTMTVHATVPGTAHTHFWTATPTALFSTVAVDKRKVNLKSANMERLVLERSLTLVESNLQISELVTDAHTKIAAFISESY